ncbi:tetratricopeptide repeat protein [Pseudomonas sp. NPDC089569]|uniref:tetratricopeptide repeat protein n=1 Tax=Pseudomonas sp. NPDC089569 TaxID=3390722 RepID=UPI003D03C6EF
MSTDCPIVRLGRVLKIGAGNLSLANAFQNSKNLADLSSAWIRHVKTELQGKGVDTKLKLQIGDSASLVAPAALVAGMVIESGLIYDQAPLRVLLIASDPLVRFDRSTWASMAGDFLGCPGNVEILLNVEEDAVSSGFPIAEGLGLKPCAVLSHEDARTAAGERIDLAIWIHPAAESMDGAECENSMTAVALANAGVPTYVTSFNEVDLLGQNFLLNEFAVELQPVGGQLARGSRAINRFGISTTSLGVEGGWCAIFSRLVPASTQLEEVDIQRVKTALRLFCVEGAIHNSWSLGQHINGVAFNRVLPVGLIGNMAIDAKNGHLFSENDATKELELVGHLWKSKLATMPTEKGDLLLWACDVKLSFMAALPKEDGKRTEAIGILDSGFKAGVVAAGVGLARSYEASKLDGGKDKALSLYSEIGDGHPISAYALAYQAYEAGDEAKAEVLFRASAEQGYPVAQADLGKLLHASGRYQEGVRQLNLAAKAGDPEANYVLGELAVKGSLFLESLDFLRKAWQFGHAEAANLGVQVAKHMLDNSIGKRSLIKRELKEVTAFVVKLETRADKMAKEQERTAALAKEMLEATLAKQQRPHQANE